MRDKIGICLFAAGLLILFIFCNSLYGRNVAENKVAVKSGTEYLDRETYLFTRELSDETAVVEQHFSPTGWYLSSLKIRLGVNWHPEEESVLRVEVKKGNKVLCYQDVAMTDAQNWRNQEISIRKYVLPGQMYTVCVRQIDGPRDGEGNHYLYAYSVFLAEEHVEEHREEHLYNGEKSPGELEICYIYGKARPALVWNWVWFNVIFVSVVLLVWLLALLSERNGKSFQYQGLRWGLWAMLPALVYLNCEGLLGQLQIITFANHLKNLVIYEMVFLLVAVLFGKLAVAAVCMPVLFVLITLVQYFVTLLRGRPLLLQDLLAVKTALTVVGNYTFRIEGRVFVCLLILLLLSVGASLLTCGFRLKKKGRLLLAVATGIISAVLGLGHKYWLLPVDMWDVKATYETGGNVLTLLSQIPYAVIREPDGYGVEEVERLINSLDQEEEVSEGPTNIILIMNESFADLEYINEIATDVELLPNWKLLRENAVRGYLYMPVFGAGTANSEYEVLTGNELSFLPQGTSAYQMNVGKDESSLVSVLEEQGYRTTALHPYMAENWNRNVVYEYMGFDRFYSDANWGEWDVIRGFPTDRSAYEKVIRVDEESTDKQFIFLVTVQNHGGYDREWSDFPNEVSLQYQNRYPQTEQYLSLLQESDRAFAELLEYYQTSQEPTLIVMFGDHQAAIEEAFYEELFGKELHKLDREEGHKRFVTPFVIWANYEIEEAEDVEMSSNYFGSYVLQQAGVRLSKYQRYLLQIMEEIPVIGHGAVKTKDGTWYGWSQLPASCTELLSHYEMLQYHNIMDRSRRISDFFR